MLLCKYIFYNIEKILMIIYNLKGFRRIGEIAGILEAALYLNIGSHICG